MTDPTTDVIVVGSGPCGAMAAHELVAAGLDVTMLDAGARAPRGMIVRLGHRTVLRRVDDTHLSTDRHVVAEDPDADQRAEWYSSQSLGGLSNYWTSAVPRFAPNDFTDGGRIDERYVWPIGYDDLRPYYEVVEHLIRITSRPGSLPSVPDNVSRYRPKLPSMWTSLCERATAGGDDMAAIPMAKGSPWMAARRSTGFNSYHCIVKPLLKRPNFHLVRSANVRRVSWCSSSARADGVEYIDTATMESKTLGARAIVVAAGAIDSTQILLRSVSSDFPDGIGNTHDVLGRYLHDHPRQWWPVRTSVPLPAMNHPIYIARDGFEGSRPLSGTSMMIGLGNDVGRAPALYGGRITSFGVQAFGTMVPAREHTVRIDRSAADRTNAPVIISMRYDDHASADMVRARERLIRVFAGLGIDLALGALDPMHPGSSVHHGGSVRMHTSPEHGMLDGWNRVHAVPNLVVCDASCFTTGPEKNPTLTSMAIAARAARGLSARLGHGNGLHPDAATLSR